MSKFSDFNFGDEGAGPDTDPTPIEDDNVFQSDDPTDTLPTDSTNYTEPGEGDSFRGDDPSVWSGNGNPEEPEAQIDQATAPVETQEQTATNPDDPSYGRQDDPDQQEHLSDEAYGDDEVDDTNVEDYVAKIDVNEEELEPDDRYTETDHKISFADSLDKLLNPLESLPVTPTRTFEEVLAKLLNPYEPVPDVVPTLEFKDVFSKLLNPVPVPDVIPTVNFADALSKLMDDDYPKTAFDQALSKLIDDEIDSLGEDDLFDIDDYYDYEDEYNIPGLGEIAGSLDINDYIGDLTNDSKILDFQDIDETLPDLAFDDDDEDYYGFMQI